MALQHHQQSNKWESHIRNLQYPLTMEICMKQEHPSNMSLSHPAPHFLAMNMSANSSPANSNTNNQSNDKKPTQCDLCLKHFATNYVLERHKKSVHEKIRDLHCPDCDYATSYRTHLQKHIKSVHQKLKDFRCQACEFRTATKSSLDRHWRNLHMKHKFKCSFCNHEEAQKWRMKQHIRTTHLGEKLYQCQSCTFSADTRRRLLSHSNSVHAGLQ